MTNKGINKLTQEEKEIIMSISKRIGNDSEGDMLRFFVNNNTKEVDIVNNKPEIKEYKEEINDVSNWIKANPNLFKMSDLFPDHINKLTKENIKKSINTIFGIDSSKNINSKAINASIKKFNLPCIWCGKSFLSDNLNQAACCQDHYSKWLEYCSETKETIKNSKIKKECAVCGKKFKTSNKDTDCCSFEHFLIKDQGLVQNHGVVIQPKMNLSCNTDTINEQSLEKNDNNKSKIKDSGNRRQFETGAVRDMAEGKGRCDLLPACALIRLSKHYENGAKKYVERNWEKGIPLSVMIDSGMRHLLKYLDGMDDEDHLTAAAWNILGAMWMEEKHPELQDIPSRKSQK